MDPYRSSDRRRERRQGDAERSSRGRSRAPEPERRSTYAPSGFGRDPYFDSAMDDMDRMFADMDSNFRDSGFPDTYSPSYGPSSYDRPPTSRRSRRDPSPSSYGTTYVQPGGSGYASGYAYPGAGPDIRTVDPSDYHDSGRSGRRSRRAPSTGPSPNIRTVDPSDYYDDDRSGRHSRRPAAPSPPPPPRRHRSPSRTRTRSDRERRRSTAGTGRIVAMQIDIDEMPDDYQHVRRPGRGEAKFVYAGTEDADGTPLDNPRGRR